MYSGTLYTLSLKRLYNKIFLFSKILLAHLCTKMGQNILTLEEFYSYKKKDIRP